MKRALAAAGVYWLIIAAFVLMLASCASSQPPSNNYADQAAAVGQQCQRGDQAACMLFGAMLQQLQAPATYRVLGY